MLFQSGPFKVRLEAPIARFSETLALMYGAALTNSGPFAEFVDYYIRLHRPHNLRRWWKPQVLFQTDAKSPFAPFPLDHAYPLFEWGLNWCIAVQAHQYLMLHSAVVERRGNALILPANPGSGKSTLCAALMFRDWRLLSDEFGLVQPEAGTVIPLPRPIPLKNESIPVFRAFAPAAVLGPIYEKTRKGDVAHVRPTAESLNRAREPAFPRWLVFPQYRKEALTKLYPFPKGRAFLKLAGNAFNYRLQGARGFKTVANIVKNCECYYLEFSDLDQAARVLDKLETS